MAKDKILIVDDEDIIIDLLKNIFQEEYEILVGKTGNTCIDIMKSQKPDLVLLDILMPEKDGFKILTEIKQIEDIAEIPVIIITALKETYNITKGFELGAEDYITKPFNVHEAKARVKTHLEIWHSRKETKDLLMRTLGGSMNMLMEVLALTNPVAFTISTKIKDMVRKIAHELHVKEIWKLELAGMLSMIGCYTLPVLAFEKILLGQKVSPSEHKLFDTYPEHGARLISRIPRMEDVAKIVENQNISLGNMPIESDDIYTTGIIILNHVLNFELLLAQGVPSDVALNILVETKDKYNSRILKIMKEILHREQTSNSKIVLLDELASGMILFQDIIKKNGMVVAKKDMKINDILKQHLILLNKIGDIENIAYIKI